MPNFSVDERGVTRTVVKGSIPKVRFQFTAEIGEFGKGHSLSVPNFAPTAEVAGIPLPVVDVSCQLILFDGGENRRGQATCAFGIALFPHIVRAIDEARKGDVDGRAELWFHSIELTGPFGPSNKYALFNSDQAPQIRLRWSRDEWALLLAEIGYDGAWVAEIPPPRPTRWPEVEALLKQAAEELRAHRATQAARLCRDAWNAARPYIGERWETTKSIMARLSKGAPNYPTVTERVVTTYDDVSRLLGDARFLADAAGHGEAHVIGDDEALLIYRLTHTLLSYLSGRTADAAAPAATIKPPG